jgi:uncharacterized protein (DUF1330 family)
MASDRPVYLVVQAAIEDAAAYQGYMDALIKAELFKRFGGRAQAAGRVFETLEGDFADNEITAIVEFPTLAAAREFWTCPEYREIAKLRAPAGRFKIGLWRQLPEPGRRHKPPLDARSSARMAARDSSSAGAGGDASGSG